MEQVLGECAKRRRAFFGILKCRFRILKLPILIRRKRDIDNVVFTCCILHNMLQTVGGLNTLEPNMNWTGADGFHDGAVPDPKTDASAIGTGRGIENDEQAELETEHDVIQGKLVASFKYRKDHGEISWC